MKRHQIVFRTLLSTSTTQLTDLHSWA